MRRPQQDQCAGAVDREIDKRLPSRPVMGWLRRRVNNRVDPGTVRAEDHLDQGAFDHGEGILFNPHAVVLADFDVVRDHHRQQASTSCHSKCTPCPQKRGMQKVYSGQ